MTLYMPNLLEMRDLHNMLSISSRNKYCFERYFYDNAAAIAIIFVRKIMTDYPKWRDIVENHDNRVGVKNATHMILSNELRNEFRIANRAIASVEIDDFDIAAICKFYLFLFDGAPQCDISSYSEYLIRTFKQPTERLIKYVQRNRNKDSHEKIAESTVDWSDKKLISEVRNLYSIISPIMNNPTTYELCKLYIDAIIQNYQVLDKYLSMFKINLSDVAALNFINLNELIDVVRKKGFDIDQSNILTGCTPDELEQWLDEYDQHKIDIVTGKNTIRPLRVNQNEKKVIKGKDIGRLLVGYKVVLDYSTLVSEYGDSLLCETMTRVFEITKKPFYVISDTLYRLIRITEVDVSKKADGYKREQERIKKILDRLVEAKENRRMKTLIKPGSLGIKKRNNRVINEDASIIDLVTTKTNEETYICIVTSNFELAQKMISLSSEYLLVTKMVAENTLECY